MVKNISNIIFNIIYTGIAGSPYILMFFMIILLVKKIFYIKFNIIYTGLAGASATFFHDAVMTPAEG